MGDPRVRAASLTSATASNVSTGNQPRHRHPLVPGVVVVEVEWKGKWWDAKVAKVEDDFFYFIEYHGYGREGDEWVTPKRMRRPTRR